MYDLINSHLVFEIQLSANDSNSFMVDTLGDVRLANSAIFIDRSLQDVTIGNGFYFDSSASRLGIGTLAPSYEIDIRDTVPEIQLYDESDSTYAHIQYNGGELALEGNSQQDIVRIDGTAPSSSLMIENDGTTTMKKAEASFSGANSAGDGLTNLFEMSANNTDLSKISDAGFLLNNSKVGFQWSFRTQEQTEGFSMTKIGTGGPELQIKNLSNDYHNVTLLLGNGAGSANGQWLDASSRDYKENIKDITSNEALKTLAGLKPVKYNFKIDPSEELNVGFIAEDVPELVATKDRKCLSPLEIVAVLTKVVQEQQELILDQQKAFNEQKEIIAELADRLNNLEKK
jgi:hypothetical protein